MHISFVYFVRQMFSKNNVGPMPPPILLLSDGGHVENLAILPLLKRRLQKIVVVDGGFKLDERFYGDSILDALMLARTKLNCSFLSVDGQDVISDLLEKFVKPRAGEYPRHYRFVNIPIHLFVCLSSNFASNLFHSHFWPSVVFYFDIPSFLDLVCMTLKEPVCVLMRARVRVR